MKEGEEFKVLKKIGEKGRTFRVVNERGQLGHLQREMVTSLWPVNASITDKIIIDTQEINLQITRLFTLTLT